jgi:hypothetical protein
MAVDVVEHEAFAAEAVERRRRSVAIAVEREMIGAKRIDRDENNRRARKTIGRGGRAGSAAARREKYEGCSLKSEVSQKPEVTFPFILHT